MCRNSAILLVQYQINGRGNKVATAGQMADAAVVTGISVLTMQWNGILVSDHAIMLHSRHSSAVAFPT